MRSSLRPSTLLFCKYSKPLFWLIGQITVWITFIKHQIDGSVQNCSISSALTIDTLQFCTKPSKYTYSKCQNLLENFYSKSQVFQISKFIWQSPLSHPTSAAPSLRFTKGPAAEHIVTPSKQKLTRHIGRSCRIESGRVRTPCELLVLFGGIRCKILNGKVTARRTGRNCFQCSEIRKDCLTHNKWSQSPTHATFTKMCNRSSFIHCNELSLFHGHVPPGTHNECPTAGT